MPASMSAPPATVQPNRSYDAGGVREYVETFDDDCGGWVGWTSNAAGPARLARRDGAVVSSSSWWVDYNHAPPGGAGYLHLLFALQTKPHYKYDATMRELAGPNRFIDGGFATSFTNARVTLRLRGRVDLHGAQLLFHAQAKVKDRYVNQTLVGRPFHVSSDWSEQTVELT